jgi:hypothetical protein
MRYCPYCKEKTISQHKLALQHAGIPAVVASCPACHAVVNIPHTNNIALLFALEWTSYGLAILLVIWSFNHFQSWFPAALVGILLYFGRSYIKSFGRLEYVR